MAAAPPTRARRTILVVAVALTMIVAGGLSTVLVLEQKAGSSSAVVNDGPTLYQALESVNTTVQNISGGPWELFSYTGFAAEATFNPAAFGIGSSTNLSLRYCGAQLPGVTLWNGSSIPVFDGSIASGTAPFWQFEFSSNSTQSIVVATDMAGTIHVYPPIPPTSPCWVYTGGRAVPTYLSWVNPLPEDSSIQAQLANVRVAASFETANRPLVEIFANGFTPLGAIGHGPNGGVEFYRCGIVGIAGVQPYLVVGFSPNGQIFDVGTGSLTCTATYSFGPPPVYVPYTIAGANLSAPESFGNGLEAVRLSLQIAFPVGVNNRSTDFDAWGLLSWMMSLAVRNSTGQGLPSAPPSCPAWVASLSSCGPSGVGWSAVLASANGSWLDSFPSSSSASSWSVPNSAIASADQIVLIYPNSWNVAGDSLVFSSSASIPTIGGTATL